MTEEKKLSFALFFMRITVFLVMFMWTLDKFVRPEHASLVFKTFYFVPEFGAFVSYLIGTVEMVIILGFLFGYQKRITYGLVLIFHALSTLSSFPAYMTPFEGPHLLFFAAWPMLVACWTLYILRDYDTLTV